MFDSSLNKALGVELKFLAENVISCRFILVMRKGDEIDFEQGKQVDGNLSEVLALLPKKYPIALNLTGKGLLHKPVVMENNQGDQTLFTYAFSAVDQKDFYVQEFIDKKHGVVSIIRKQMVDELLERMGRAGLSVYSVSLGALISSVVWSQLNNYGQQIQLAEHLFKLDENRAFLSYENARDTENEFDLKVGNISIDQHSILAYAAAFQLLLHDRLILLVADVDSVNAAFKGFISTSYFQTKAKYFLLVMFASLFVSFILYSHYNEKNTQLLVTQGARSAGDQQTDLLQQKIGDQEILLKRLNWYGGYNLGFLLTELGTSLPRQLKWTGLSINEVKPDPDNLTNTGMIKVSGISNDPIRVNNWIFELKKKAWIKGVTLLKFQEDKDQQQYQFTLNITY